MENKKFYLPDQLAEAYRAAVVSRFDYIGNLDVVHEQMRAVRRYGKNIMQCLSGDISLDDLNAPGLTTPTRRILYAFYTEGRA